VKSIPGFKKTQGIAYVPSLNKLFVASGDDGCSGYSGVTRSTCWESVKLDLGHNRVAYDPHTQILYVGTEARTQVRTMGKIGIIDPKTDSTSGTSKVEAHPSELLLDESGKTLFVFVSVASVVQVVDTKETRSGVHMAYQQ